LFTFDVTQPQLFASVYSFSVIRDTHFWIDRLRIYTLQIRITKRSYEYIVWRLHRESSQRYLLSIIKKLKNIFTRSTKVPFMYCMPAVHVKLDQS